MAKYTCAGALRTERRRGRRESGGESEDQKAPRPKDHEEQREREERRQPEERQETRQGQGQRRHPQQLSLISLSLIPMRTAHTSRCSTSACCRCLCSYRHLSSGHLEPSNLPQSHRFFCTLFLFYYVHILRLYWQPIGMNCHFLSYYRYQLTIENHGSKGLRRPL